ncbi:DUF805 domain-containing protein [Aestuariivirga litoralis]|uniref:DUF805 domain-containing protein n=1 Tax=Aestuariivirga litoralis TaxID=2650924 RepID=UPI0018C4E381|nr:DUF805 domain-containing protein [Aestuariivirga litoralis]MBG1231733.1 DUF805 domain-containing protein [Aestuariivirga litoralis]
MMTFGSLMWVTGRSSRQHWWLVQLGCMVILALLFFSLLPSDGWDGLTQPRGQLRLDEGTSPVLPLTSMADFLRNFGFYSSPLSWVLFVSHIRRYHDRNKSGWWSLVAVIPVIGGLWQLIELGFLPGNPDKNNYGPPPGAVRLPAGFDQELDELEEKAGGLAKVDDAYLANYAQKFAASQQQELAIAGPATASSGPRAFGKRR